LAEKIAVVGPRKGADLEAVEGFLRSLWLDPYEYIIVSGGAEGVDKTAEQTWLSLGGIVWSYRIRKKAEEHFVTEKWELGGEQPRVFELLGEPSWMDPVSALHYRSMIVADEADKIVAFSGIDRMRGTDFTIWASIHGEEKPTYVWRDGEWETHNV
jgi:hypothetical protein